MLEEFCKKIINELGVVGLLVVGLYIVVGQYLKKISYHIERINHNSEKIAEKLEIVIIKLCDIENGKN